MSEPCLRENLVSLGEYLCWCIEEYADLGTRDVNLIEVLGATLTSANPVIAGIFDAGGNRMPAMDVAARPGFVDVTDRAARLLGIVYGDLAQLQQIATPADALVPANTLESTGLLYVYNGATWDRVREGATAGSILTDVSDRAARLLGVIYGSEGQPLYQDPVEPAAVTIDFSHHEIHEENHYTCNTIDTDVDIAAPKIVRCTTPNTSTRIHWLTEVSADGAALVEFYENPTINAAGNAMAEYNNDRNSLNVAENICREDATTTNDGTLLFSRFIGGAGVGGRSTSGELGTRQEWILKQNEDYIVKVTVAADNTQVSISNTWYEV